MHVLVMRFVFTIYLVGMAWIFYNSLSEVLFAENIKFPTRIKKFFKKILFSFVWPISLFSVDGRKKLAKGLRDV